MTYTNDIIYRSHIQMTYTDETSPKHKTEIETSCDPMSSDGVRVVRVLCVPYFFIVLLI